VKWLVLLLLVAGCRDYDPTVRRTHPWSTLYGCADLYALSCATPLPKATPHEP
jgi:hypothetical protein